MEKVDHIIREFKTQVKGLYGPRLQNMILYGSWARGEATEESDVDLVVVLEGAVKPVLEIGRMIEIITDINLKYNVLLSVYPTSDSDYADLKSPLMMNVRREGVPA